MKNEELAAQLRLAASILETRHPWEFRRAGDDEVEWRYSATGSIGEILDMFTDGYEIRLALATPGDSRPLHNPDNLTAEQVGAGWRLALPNEQLPPDFQIWDESGLFWYACTATQSFKPLESTRLPLSTPWPEAKVDEFAELKAAHKAGKVIQFFLFNDKWEDCLPIWNHAPNRYRIKPDPIMVPLEAVDVLPGSVFRCLDWQKHGGYFTPSVHKSGVSWTSGIEVLFETFANLLEKNWQINRSIPITGKWDADAWEKCEKEAV